MIVKIIMLLFFINLAGCSLMPHMLYKVDVQQGNVVTDEMLETLKQGMTKSQVRFVLGSPLVVDAFRDNRWDYLYIQRKSGDLVEQKRLTVYFENDRLIQVENQQLFSLDSDEPESIETLVQPKQKIEQPESGVVVERLTPEETMVLPEPKAVVNQPGADAIVDQPRPEATIAQPDDEETIDRSGLGPEPKPEVIVDQPRPYEATPLPTVNQAEPEVAVDRPSQEKMTDPTVSEMAVDELDDEVDETALEYAQPQYEEVDEAILRRRLPPNKNVDTATLRRRQPCHITANEKMPARQPCHEKYRSN